MRSAEELKKGQPVSLIPSIENALAQMRTIAFVLERYEISDALSAARRVTKCVEQIEASFALRSKRLDQSWANIEHFRAAGVGETDHVVELAYKDPTGSSKEPPRRAQAVRLHPTKPWVLIRVETNYGAVHRWRSAAHLSLIVEVIDFATLAEGTPLLLDNGLPYTVLFLRDTEEGPRCKHYAQDKQGYLVKREHLKPWVLPVKR